MNRFFFFLLIFIVPAFSAEDAPEGYKRVKISEVCFWPEEGESEWIELYNASDSVIDISGWKLQWSGGGEFVLPESELLLEPMEVVVVILDSLSRVPVVSDMTIAASKQGFELSSFMMSLDNFLGNQLVDSVFVIKTNLNSSLDNYCADILLIDSNVNCVDKVLWGCFEDLLCMPQRGYVKLLNNIDFGIRFLGAETSINPPKQYLKRVGQGSSISLLEDGKMNYFNTWLVCNKDEISLGYLDNLGYLQRPLPAYPDTFYSLDGANTSNNDFYISSMISPIPNIKYQFCISSDSNFVSGVDTSQATSSRYYEIDTMLLPNHKENLYWKMRYVWQDGTKGRWSGRFRIYGGNKQKRNKPRIRSSHLNGGS